MTYHPDREGEIRGKSSNLAYAARWAKHALVDEIGVDIRDVIVTVCDADSRLHPKYLSALTFGFITNPSRRYAIWQPALMFYSNIWRIPAVARISAGLYSVWQLSRLVASYKLVTQSTYSLGLATCHAVGYWDVDVIPEDSRMFFKVFFALGPRAARSRSSRSSCRSWRTLPKARASGRRSLSHYRQTRRWAWGVSDVPYVLRRAFERRAVPLWARVRRVGVLRRGARLLADPLVPADGGREPGGVLRADHGAGARRRPC